jgi:hypothetical protein
MCGVAGFHPQDGVQDVLHRQIDIRRCAAMQDSSLISPDSSLLSPKDHELSYLHELTDLREPHKWFPGARKMKRKWILHVGPTNSGARPTHGNPRNDIHTGNLQPEPETSRQARRTRR